MSIRSLTRRQAHPSLRTVVHDKLGRTRGSHEVWMNKPAVLYARVSSDQQKEKHTIQSQTTALSPPPLAARRAAPVTGFVTFLVDVRSRRSVLILG